MRAAFGCSSGKVKGQGIVTLSGLEDIRSAIPPPIREDLEARHNGSHKSTSKEKELECSGPKSADQFLVVKGNSTS